jgi:hypothetical protein
MAKKRLFVAVLVLQSRVGEQDDKPIVDHQVRLIRALNVKAAYARALEFGKAENASYKNQVGQTVTWEFLGLAELDRLDENQLRDGGEVFSWRTLGIGTDLVRKREQLAVFATKETRSRSSSRKQ